MRKLYFVLALLFACAVSAAAPDAATPADLIREADAAIDAQNLSAFQSELASRIGVALTDVAQADLANVSQLAAFREFAKFFGTSKALTEDKETLKWLVGQPILLPTLMSAVDESDSPDGVVAVLKSLRDASGGSLENVPDLATAFAVVWDKPSPSGTEPSAQNRHVVQMFNYFLNTRGQARFDLQKMPWQLSVFVVDMKLRPDEIQWAMQRYSHLGPVASCYFDVPYDDDAFNNGGKKKIDAHDYTLPNILQYGGICVDQAYYASQVAKTMSIPSCVCSGASGAGAANHAWVGVLEDSSGRALWNFDEGRYSEDLYWSASIKDPQTGKEISEGDVGLTGDLLNTPADARVESSLLVKVEEDAPEASRMDLLERAINLSPGNRAAWVALAKLGREGRLSPDQLESVGRVVQQYAAQSYPDFAWQMLVNMCASQPPSQRVESLNNISRLFSARPDLVARIRNLQGDLYRKLDQDDLALGEYGDILTNYLNTGPIVMEAMQRVDEMLRAKQDLNHLVRIYDSVWPKLAIPDRSAFAFETPFAVVGKAYADLLDSMGNESAADNIRTRIKQLVVEPPAAAGN
ncbi:MAG: hypothetical protein ABSG31_14610 [Tepidisphaeraceae bacterium]|jgi:hypothetical protein